MNKELGLQKVQMTKMTNLLEKERKRELKAGRIGKAGKTFAMGIVKARVP